MPRNIKKSAGSLWDEVSIQCQLNTMTTILVNNVDYIRLGFLSVKKTKTVWTISSGKDKPTTFGSYL